MRRVSVVSACYVAAGVAVLPVSFARCAERRTSERLRRAIDAATMRRLLVHEARVHAMPDRELRDLGDAILLHDPTDPEPFWNRLEALRWPDDPDAFDRAPGRGPRPVHLADPAAAYLAVPASTTRPTTSSPASRRTGSATWGWAA